jgi:hypothetical protein
MQGAFAGKYLRVNLSEGTTAVEEFPPLTYRLFMGGAAMAASVLMRELRPGIDPLGPENVLIFATCPLTGIPLSGTTRFSVVAKSPLTDGYGEGEAGGYWGPELKYAGFDGIVVTGQSPKPVYLWICDGQVELRDGAHLWGRLSGAVQDVLTAETDKRARILQCGIAGERGNLMANIVNELKHFNGRSGLGAVMGSKKLRAIAVRGHDRIEPKDKEGLQACLKWFREHYDRDADTLHKLGTSRNVVGMNTDGILPTRNFREGQFEYAKEISGQTMAETILTDEGTCHACAIACKRDVDVPKRGVIAKYGGPEYETIGSGGSVCGIGDLLALGSARAAKQIGGGAEQFALTVKKQEIPMHEPRGKQGLSLAYATAPAGADHMRAPHDPAYAGFHPKGGARPGAARPCRTAVKARVEPAQGARISVRQPLVGPVQLRGGVPLGLGARQRGRHHADRQRHAGRHRLRHQPVGADQSRRAIQGTGPGLQLPRGLHPEGRQAAEAAARGVHRRATCGRARRAGDVPAGPPALPPDGGLGPRDGLADVCQAVRARDRVGSQAGGHVVTRARRWDEDRPIDPVLAVWEENEGGLLAGIHQSVRPCLLGCRGISML